MLLAEEKQIAKLTKEKSEMAGQMQVLQAKMKSMEIELKEAKAKVADAKSQIDTAAAAAAGKAREVSHACNGIHSFSFMVCSCVLGLCMGIALPRGRLEPAASLLRFAKPHRC